MNVSLLVETHETMLSSGVVNLCTLGLEAALEEIEEKKPFQVDSQEASLSKIAKHGETCLELLGNLVCVSGAWRGDMMSLLVQGTSSFADEKGRTRCLRVLWVLCHDGTVARQVLDVVEWTQYQGSFVELMARLELVLVLVHHDLDTVGQHVLDNVDAMLIHSWDVLPKTLVVQLLSTLTTSSSLRLRMSNHGKLIQWMKKEYVSAQESSGLEYACGQFMRLVGQAALPEKKAGTKRGKEREVGTSQKVRGNDYVSPTSQSLYVSPTTSTSQMDARKFTPSLPHQQFTPTAQQKTTHYPTSTTLHTHKPAIHPFSPIPIIQHPLSPSSHHSFHPYPYSFLLHVTHIHQHQPRRTRILASGQETRPSRGGQHPHVHTPNIFPLKNGHVVTAP